MLQDPTGLKCKVCEGDIVESYSLFTGTPGVIGPGDGITRKSNVHFCCERCGILYSSSFVAENRTIKSRNP